jgi:gas vesicle protein
MKNPLAKKDHAGLIVGLVIGAFAAGALAYLYLTGSGDKLRKSIKQQLKDGAKDLAAGVISDKTGVKKKMVKKVADEVVK